MTDRAQGCMLVNSALLFLGAATVAFMTAVAFAGHPSDQFIWLVTKWQTLFSNDPSASIELFALMPSFLRNVWGRPRSGNECLA